MYSEDEGMVDPHVTLAVENDRLKEMIASVNKKCVAYDAEVRGLLRKAIKLLEEKVEYLENGLQHVANMDNIVNL